MKNLTLLLITTLFALTAQAGIGAYSGTTNLGAFGYVKCSTGITCTKVGDKLNMVSSPTLVGPLTLETGGRLSNSVSYDLTWLTSGETTLSVTGFEDKGASLRLYADEGDDSADKWSIAVSTDDSLSFKNNTTILETRVASGDVSGLGTGALYGYRNRTVPASGTLNITTAMCGQTFVSSAATSGNLPEASTAIGCRYTFVVGATGASFDVNPADGTDTIKILTNAAGDAIQGTTFGNSVILQAVGADLWVPVGKEQGTWSDIN